MQFEHYLKRTKIFVSIDDFFNFRTDENGKPTPAEIGRFFDKLNNTRNKKNTITSRRGKNAQRKKLTS